MFKCAGASIGWSRKAISNRARRVLQPAELTQRTALVAPGINVIGLKRNDPFEFRQCPFILAVLKQRTAQAVVK